MSRKSKKRARPSSQTQPTNKEPARDADEVLGATANRSRSGFRIATFEARYVSGPLPSPDILKQYDTVVPGSAERIITMAEQQGDHRRDLERKVIDSNIANERRGQRLGFILTLAAMAFGVLLVQKGATAAGVTSVLGALAVLAGVFVYGKYAGRRELAEKTRQVPPPSSSKQ